MSRRHLIYAIVGVAVVAALVGDALSLFGRGDSATAPGKPAPPLPSEVLVPPRVTIASLRGRPAAINFWASCVSRAARRLAASSISPASCAGGRRSWAWIGKTTATRLRPSSTGTAGPFRVSAHPAGA